jgi:hypothetical protein
MRGRAAKGMRVASADFYEETGKTAEKDLASRT